jgi:hypothetical protein
MEENMLKRPSFMSTRNIIIALGALLVIALGVAVYFYQQANVNSPEQSQKELDEVVAKVGKLMVLPADETPTLATVSDPEKLKDQKFFANAKTGDKVLIYSRAQKAVLYSPSLNKIIEVAPVNIGGQ